MLPRPFPYSHITMLRNFRGRMSTTGNRSLRISMQNLGYWETVTWERCYSTSPSGYLQSYITFSRWLFWSNRQWLIMLKPSRTKCGTESSRPPSSCLDVNLTMHCCCHFHHRVRFPDRISCERKIVQGYFNDQSNHFYGSQRQNYMTEVWLMQ